MISTDDQKNRTQNPLLQVWEAAERKNRGAGISLCLPRHQERWYMCNCAIVQFVQLLRMSQDRVAQLTAQIFPSKCPTSAVPTNWQEFDFYFYTMARSRKHWIIRTLVKHILSCDPSWSNLDRVANRFLSREEDGWVRSVCKLEQILLWVAG